MVPIQLDIDITRKILAGIEEVAATSTDPRELRAMKRQRAAFNRELTMLERFQARWAIAYIVADLRCVVQDADGDFELTDEADTWVLLNARRPVQFFQSQIGAIGFSTEDEAFAFKMACC